MVAVAGALASAAVWCCGAEPARCGAVRRGPTAVRWRWQCWAARCGGGGGGSVVAVAAAVAAAAAAAVADCGGGGGG
eukprot:5465600-Prymnesium_polylepis.1